MNLKRRSFLSGGAVLAASAALPAAAKKSGKSFVEVPPANGGRAEEAAKKLVLGEPFLQAPSDTTMGVAWTVNVLANGWVEYAENPELRDAKTAVCGSYGVTGFDDRILQVRLTDLKPATKYWYRIHARHIDYVHNYKRYPLDTAVGEIHSFTTFGPGATAHFCVMNDTHANWESFCRVTEKITSIRPSTILWNGDAQNQTEDRETGVRIFLEPPIPHPGYATDTPILWVNGNHDLRGLWARKSESFVMTRLPSERDSRDWALTRNFAVRLGDVAMIGLDTGEDKPDAHPQFVGLVRCEPYRVAQTAWLEDQFKRPEIAGARFVVAFCHIPLFDPDPEAHPGGLIDNGGGKYRTSFSAWEKSCADMWGPVLARNGCQLVIAAHQHCYRFDPATPERPWAQIIGGGPKITKAEAPSYPTVIEGCVADGLLKVTVHNIRDNTVQATHTFSPRSV